MLYSSLGQASQELIACNVPFYCNLNNMSTRVMRPCVQLGHMRLAEPLVVMMHDCDALLAVLAAVIGSGCIVEGQTC